MIDGGSGTGFALESQPDIGGCGQIRAQHFHRDRTSESQIPPVVHVTHAAVAEQTAQFIAAGERFGGGHPLTLAPFVSGFAIASGFICRPSCRDPLRVARPRALWERERS